MPTSAPWTDRGDRWGGDHGGPPWVRWVDQERPRRRIRWFATIFSQLVQLPIIIWLLVTDGPAPQLIASVVAFAASYLLLLLPRYPGPIVVAVACAVAPAIVLVTGGPPLAAVPLAFAVVQATIRGARVWVWSTITVGAAAAVTYGTLAGSPQSLVRSLIALLVLCLLVGAGEGARTRADRYREYRESLRLRRQSEAEQERLRIARELHDVLAHSLSSINVQAGVGLHLIEERPEKAAEALANIKATSKSALDEVRGVLGFLRSSDDGAPLVPAPELGRLPALTASLSALGVAVTLDDALAPSAPLSTERTIYRIVQEALTNVTRHSDATKAAVSLATQDGVDVVVIADNGMGEHRVIEEGRGLLGMRERAHLLGGTVSLRWGDAGSDLGGLLVEARLPRAGRESS